MGRTRLLLINLILGAAGATVLGMLLRGRPLSSSSAGSAFVRFGIAGFLVGATVGIGATLGPRPALGMARCVLAQGLVALTSAVGGFLGGLFPHVLATADRAVHEALEQRGIVVGSWLGVAAGTLLEIIHVYRMRRRGADPGPRTAARSPRG